MDVTLKNLRHNPRLSHETNAFTADIWIDGKKAGYAENAGHGGSTLIQPRECRDRLNAYAATLPRVQTDLPDHEDPSRTWSYQPDAENLVDDLVTKTLQENHVKRILSKRVIYTVKGKKGLYQTKVVKADVLKTWLAMPVLAEKLGADKILNLIPLSEAVAIFAACGGKGDDE